MIKQDWLQVKSTQQITPEIIYEFWNENKKPEYKDISFEEFNTLIKLYIQNGNTVSINKLEEFFDKKFNITKVYDKDKQLIKEF